MSKISTILDIIFNAKIKMIQDTATFEIYENDTSPIAVGKRLSYLRKLAKLSREELAKKANVGKSTISYWEHAKPETSTMTQKSMDKVLKVFREVGVECSDHWLRNGLGPRPYLITHFTAVATSTAPILPTGDNLITKLLASLAEEVKLFTSLGNGTVVTKVNTSGLSPVLEKGDIVGGIWQASSQLKSEKLCIIHLNDELQVRRVQVGLKPGLFHISYLSHAPNQLEPFELKDIPLDKLAPIIRVWRTLV